MASADISPSIRSLVLISGSIVNHLLLCKDRNYFCCMPSHCRSVAAVLSGSIWSSNKSVLSNTAVPSALSGTVLDQFCGFSSMCSLASAQYTDEVVVSTLH